MVPRYSRKEMVDIWSDDSKYSIWLDIEVYALEGMELVGIVPKGTAKVVREKATFNSQRIDEIESEIKHDVLAFLTNISESVGPEARFIHQGMTSSDVLDTCLNMQLKKAGELLIKDLDSLLEAIKFQAINHKKTICVGRSHGIHAEPTTFGLKMLQAYAEFARNKDRMINAVEEISSCAISGSVGTFANIDPYVEEYVAKALNLNIEPISTQVIPRDRHAVFFSTLAIISSSIERLSTEIRHLQRSEVLEVEEYFSSKQKGSSSMPHKRNPVLTENLTGLARVVRSSVTPALENITLWHERDISHSSVERFIGPDATITLDFALNRLTNVVENMVVYPENMMKNLEKFNGLVFSQRVLLSLTQKNISREDSYSMVQRNSMKVWNEEGSFYDLIKADKEISSILSDEEIDDIFDLNYHLKQVETIFKRVLK
ncbi:MAG: adenylosuccinate lyase [Hyphomicrobiales bacterium]|jgi:adenylosuccinate lyase|nr:adenylosuccinate lyase [Alphaproteobacteria bacterium]MDG1152179.1 adenylosuccinate lyase [Hyphomicrobiales bacterium]MDG1523407.1 adenylosuccinate lyase [Hyphomicrobiales bacterium]MDG1665349.1 adenylosuccinate lyase [Hyphomicrobiales bacterium]MDG2413829.1 adenylosuccinate lyase [Hyphomicrobiales bacterium]|tara:strand:- start:64 stop:1356 length:1293 start_codon:yes stop_codon:yes gene_type:complete